MALVMSAGGQIMSADNRDIGFDSPEGLAAFDLFKQFGEAGQVEMSLDQTWQAFAGGKLGILVTSSSFLNAAEKGAAAGNFKIKTTTLPLAENGRLPVGGNAAMLLATDPVRQKAAWEFMKYMTSPEAQTLLVNTSGYIPANTLVAASPKYLGEYYSTHPNAMVGVKQMPSLTAWPTFPGENSIKITDTIMEYIQSVITLKMEPKDALAAMAGDVRAMLPAS
jgi:multiple sugar transport system substrate-binding protein